MGMAVLLCNPETMPRPADTASVKRSRRHAKMRAKPLGIGAVDWAVEDMPRTIEQGAAPGAALMRRRKDSAVVRPLPAQLTASRPSPVACRPARESAAP
jgi:hypothetical protein